MGGCVLGIHVAQVREHCVECCKLSNVTVRSVKCGEYLNKLSYCCALKMTPAVFD